jgi:hypothetical protein
MHEDFRRAVDSKDVNVVPVGDTLVPDVIDFLRTQAIWIVGAVIIGGAAGTAIAMIKPKLWEATAIVQIGQVGYLEPPGAVGMIETVPNAVERITGLVKQGPEDELFQSKQIPEKDIATLRSTFNAQSLPNTSFIRMTVRGTSPEEAKSAMQTVEDQLVQVHTKMLEPALSRLKDAQARASAINAEVEKRRAGLQAQAELSAGKPASPQDLMLSTLIDKVDQELRDIEGRQAQLTEQLSSDRSFPTRPVGELSVSPGPVSPRVPYYVTAGAVLGLLVGVVIGMSRQFGRRVRRP